MALDLPTRRALLKNAMAPRRSVLSWRRASEVEHWHAFAEACSGATEQERAALARTLPPAQLVGAEGATGRALYVLAALGKPAALVEVLSIGMPTKIEHLLQRRATVITAVIEASRGRSEAWLEATIDGLSHTWSTRSLTWPIVAAMVEMLGRSPGTEHYLQFVLRCADSDVDPSNGRTGEQIVEWLRENPVVVDRDFWEIFHVAGGWADWLLSHSRQAGWNDALRLLMADRGFRARLLDESLDGLLRDFSARNVRWYHHVHRLADPTSDEITVRADRYLAVLGAEPSTSIGLAQEMLGRTVAQLDPEALIHASRAVLMRKEKKLVTAQLGLLRQLIVARPEHADGIRSLVGTALASLPADLAALARDIAGPAHEPAPFVPDDFLEGVPAGVPVIVAPPALRALPTAEESHSPIVDDGLLFELIGQQLADQGESGDLVRILATVAEREVSLPRALAQQVSTVATQRQRSSEVSLRAHLAKLLALEPARRRSMLRRPARTLLGLSQGRSHDWGTYGFGRWVMPSHSPTFLLESQFRTPPITEPLSPLARSWSSAMLTPGGGSLGGEEYVVGIGPKPFWLPVAEAPLPKDATIGQLALDVADVPAEFTFRVEEARRREGYSQVVQWTAWLLQHNPDTFSAHCHPALWAAMQVVNVQGIEAILSALASTRQVPGLPTYSALVLGLSAKEAPHRVAAADAIATLVDGGLLSPELLADQLGAHLKLGNVLVGRVAPALADAATVSALTGYRMLQALIALLPELGAAQKAAPLVELTARLAADYGTPVTIPETLASKAKGRNVMAAALQMLASVRPHRSAMAVEAAAQAG